jgi:hypothetical protein
MNETGLSEDWGSLTGLLPEGWREQARLQGARKRARKVRDAEQLLRYILMHVAPGLSLAQAVARAAQCGLPEISDVALMDRMRASEQWLRWMCQRLLEQRYGAAPGMELRGGYRVVAVDSTTIQEPGATGTDWRLHYAIELPGLFCEQAQLTGSQGGESLCRFEIRAGDLLLGDRNFCKAAQIRHVPGHGAEVLLRWHGTALPLFEREAKPVDVAAWLKGLASRQCAQRLVTLKGQSRPMRLCAIRVSGKVAQRQRAAAYESARKNGREPSALSLLLCDYIVVVTSLPEAQFDARSVLRLYRLRWQIEPAFKRLKSLLGTGHVPKVDPRSSRAWLQAKLLTCLLIEKIILEAGVFSPWGFLLPEHQPLG